METTCFNCGKNIQIDMYKYKRNKHNFCSKACTDVFRKGKKTGKRNRFIPQPKRRKKFPMDCKYCGKTVMIAPSKLQGRDHFYCSFNCRDLWNSENRSGSNSPSWRGGHKHYYGDNWKQQRIAARVRDNYTCQNCGITELDYGKHLAVHHIKPFITFDYVPGGNENYKQANRLENLVSLCDSCHKKIEPPKILFQMKMFGIKAIEILRAKKKNKPYKKCAKCGTIKPVADFNKTKQTLDGHHPYCKQCRKEYTSNPDVMEKRRIKRRSLGWK